eukprot:gene10212-biopygen4932
MAHAARLEGDRRSGWRAVESGVPQGAVLSPLLYALYTTGVDEAVQGASVVQYADDITLAVRGRTAREAQVAMDAALAQYHAWATAHRIMPEPTKTQLLLSRSTAQLRALEDCACTMADAQTRPANVIKVLVRRAARHLPRADLATLMAAMCHPYVDYCQAATARPSCKADRTMRRAYERAARVAAGLPPDAIMGHRRVRRTRSALYVLREWPTWARRRAASRAAWAMS